ncbi:MAG TPA: prepilin-type N-terminal cleavage/methylation domain-containing protein [Xanthomonadaceae bacterium]|nr:prepilin-type N-terminal cleavage/methylation domain-containing protein [Xanthomonadaceae bacterium]
MNHARAQRRSNGSCLASDQRGYTLLEVLVAFALLAIGLGLLLAILSGGVHAVANASDSTRATLYAEGVLDTLGADQRLQPGRSAGVYENGRYRWTLDITPFKPPVAAPVRGDPNIVDPNLQNFVDNVMYRVVLQMQWGARGPGQTLRVETLRAYSPQQGPQGLQQ